MPSETKKSGADDAWSRAKRTPVAELLAVELLMEAKRLHKTNKDLLAALLLFRRIGQSRTDGKPCYCDSQPLRREEHSRACLAARAAIVKATGEGL